MKVILTAIFSVLFLCTSAQSYFGVVAGVGSGYRFLKSPYIELNYAYNTSEMPSFATLFGLSYTYKIKKRWAFQLGAQQQISGYSANYDGDFRGEILNDSAFGLNQDVLGLKKNYWRIQVPVVWQYRGKAAQNWQMILGVGLSANFIIQERTAYYFQHNTTTTTDDEFGITAQKYITGTVLQLGWSNALKSGHEICFLVGYNQDLKPIKNMPVYRKLLLLHFTLGYHFRA